MSPHGSLGLLALVSIVIGSQLGSGVFLFPSVLAPFKTIGLFGWVVSVTGAISLALIFSKLSSRMPKDGGPHVYVKEAFGKTAGFFSAWIYWLISWASNPLLLITFIEYFSVIVGPMSPMVKITIEIVVLALLTLINIKGVKTSSIIETVLTILKIIPLFILPVLFFAFFDKSFFDFSERPEMTDMSSIPSIISRTAMLTFWGFIGVESATTPASSVRNPSKTLPRAIIIGTTCVALVYILNTISVYGVTGFTPLEGSLTPFATAVTSIFGENSWFDEVISIIAMIVCAGTLNAWILTAGQIAVGASEDKLFPARLGKKNSEGAPVTALIIASLGMIPLLILGTTISIDRFIDMLVSVFLVVYIICSLAYLTLLKKWGVTGAKRIKNSCLAIFAILFCSFLLFGNIMDTILIIILLSIIGLPVYYKTMKQAR